MPYTIIKGDIYMNKSNATMSVILALLMIATPLAAMPFVAGETGAPVQTPMFMGGDGSIGNPYWIVNVSDLQNMSTDLTAHYKLVNDIDASNTSVPGHWANNGGLGFDPIGDNIIGFTSTFNGQNFTITDLYINRSGDDYTGLFGYVNSTAWVKYVGLENVNVNGNGNVGGLIGRNEGTSVDKCSSFGIVTGSGDYVGGLIGFSDGPVSDSTSFSKVSNLGAGTRYTGGLIGRQDGSTVSSCEAHGNVTDSSSYTGGLIGFTLWGTLITNCSTYGVTKGTGSSNGGLVGSNGGTILNSYAYGDTGDNKPWTGGLVGYNTNLGDIQNSSAYGDVSGNSITGGLAGENEGSISYCQYNETVTGAGDTGGIVGRNSGGTISNCISNGTVTGNGNNVGGLVGYSTGPVSDSTSFGDVFNIAPVGDNYYGTGGLIGKLEGATATVSSSEANGNVSGCKFYTGGLIGHIATGATVMDSSAHGVITGNSYIGGLAGRNEGTIINSHAYGDTGDTKPWTGGLVGHNYGAGLIQNSSAHGDVFGGSITGGLVGENSGTIERSFSTGDVIATSGRVGGFVGWNNGNFVGEITDCYSQGNITGGTDDGIGGFVGNHSYGASITNVYSTGVVTGLINVSGLVAVNWISTVTDSHWDVETSGQVSSINGTGHDTDDMMSQSTFTNWDFTNTWGIHEANTYPFLLPFGVPPEPVADLEITLIDLQDPASTNGTLTYMVTLTNHGPDNAANVYVNITLPLGVTFLNSNEPLNVNGRHIDVDAGSMLNGESGGVFINVSVDSFGTGELNCTAFVTSSTLDPGAFDNETYELTQLHWAPVAVDDTETLDEDSGATTIYVLENDTDKENDDIIIDSVTQPNNGTVVITEAGKNLTFEPDADWNGINTFTYTVIDDVGGKDTATVNITVLAVDDASIAVDDAYNVTEDSDATTFDVLANDYDIDGDTITISTATQPAHGSISIAVDGLSIDYTPDADFFGADSFTYNVSSGISPATVTVNVTPVNDAPIITTSDNTTAAEDVSYSVDYNATDVESDTLTWDLETNATWLSIGAADGILAGTPVAGIYWVNVTVADDNGGSDWSNFTLTVTGTGTTEPTDTDGDGTPDDEDDFPNDANETTDTDGDGVGDNADAFPDDATEDTDTDDDGTGDNVDAFPDDATEDTDTDGDGTGDNADAFPDDATEDTDTDGDGIGDNADTDDDADDDTDDDASNNSWLYIIIILVVVGAIAGYLVMRGKGEEPVEETPEEVTPEESAPVEETPIETDVSEETSTDVPDVELEELDL